MTGTIGLPSVDALVGTASDPVGALLRWLHARTIAESAVLMCEHTVAPSLPVSSVGVRVVGCVANVGLTLPAQLLASGVRDVRVCACAERPGAVVARVEQWRRAFGAVDLVADDPSPRRRHRGPVFDLANPSVPRRALFGVRQREAPFDLSVDDAARGLAALRLLRHAGRLSLDPTVTTPADLVAISLRADGCTACGVCVRACPSGALDLAHSDEVSVLRHAEDACRSHQQCITLCPEDALSATHRLTSVDVIDRAPVELASIATAVCSRCRVRHPETDGSLCPTCRFRRANPFGSRLPPRRGRGRPTQLGERPLAGRR